MSDFLAPTYLGGPTIDQNNCEREPIHIPGAVQPHGTLLVADGLSGQLVQAAANLGQFLPVPAASAHVNDLLGEGVWESIERALSTNAPDTLQFQRRVGALNLTAHRAGGRAIIELEPLPARSISHEQQLRNAVFALENARNVDELGREIVDAVRRISGFDRVMLYRFEPDNSGLVVAEAKREDLHGFLGHRFPESDIPAQARALYVRHLLRLTADVNAPGVPLRPQLDPETGQPTPLGGAVLRATSPMHLQYLRNMGVASSLSVSVVMEGRLWGLIACHHESPLVLSAQTRTALEYLGRLAGLQMTTKFRAETDQFRLLLAQQHARLIETAARTLNPLEDLGAQQADLLSLMRASGAALFFEDQWRVLGKAPPKAFLHRLHAWLQLHPEQVYVTDSLQADFTSAAQHPEAAGLLALSIGGNWQEAVMWFRAEVQYERAWGGATPEHAKGDLGPRQSFDTYRQQVSGHSLPWHPGELEEARSLQLNLTTTLGARLNTLRELNVSLEQSRSQWREVAFMMSHDLQEPVRRIAQAADLVSSRAERGPQMLPFLKSSADELRTTVRRLRDHVEQLGKSEKD